MVKKVVLISPEREVRNVTEFILFLIMFVTGMTIGILAYMEWVGMINIG